MLKLGFTGTQREPNNLQRRELVNLFAELHPFELHHGDCIGADHLAHMLARRLDQRVILHPPKFGDKRAYCDFDVSMPPQPYLCRNHNIVLATQRLVAVPATSEEYTRSGTWSTVRYARKLKRPIIIIVPSGERREERCS